MKHDDYLNLSSHNDHLEEPDDHPKAIYIAPLVIGLVLLTATLLGLYIWRTWEREPVLTEEKITEEKLVVTASQKTSKLDHPPASEAPTFLPKEKLTPPESLSSLIRSLEPAVGMVLARTDTGVTSGSGFVIKPEGLFITNYHVVEGAREIGVKLPDREPVRAYTASYDTLRDLALLRFESGSGYPTLQLDTTRASEKGEDVLVLGYPLGTKLGLDISVSTGIISSVRNYEDIKVLQTTAAINHGNSGGPLIRRADGRVIGIVTARVKNSESIGLAVDARELQSFLEGK